VGTGSSRKSATNSVIWATGQDIPFVPNKRFGGVTLGGKIAPIFFNTQEDSGALPIEVDVSQLEMGDVLEIYPYEGKITRGGATVVSDCQSAGISGITCFDFVPLAAAAGCYQGRFHPGAKNGWTRRGPP
jgi:aconitase B